MPGYYDSLSVYQVQHVLNKDLDDIEKTLRLFETEGTTLFRFARLEGRYNTICGLYLQFKIDQPRFSITMNQRFQALGKKFVD